MRKVTDFIAAIAVVAAAVRSVFGRSTQTAPNAAALTAARPAATVRPSQLLATRDSTQTPPAGVKDILGRVGREMKEDNLPTVAAAMSFYGLLALFPALIAIVLLYGIIADPADVQRQIGEIADILPESAADTVSRQLDQIAAGSGPGLGVGLVLSLAATLWTVSSGVSALIKAINQTFDETESRGFVKLRLLALALTVGVVVFVVAAVFALTALPAVLESIEVSGQTVDLVIWLRWPLLAFGLVIGLALFYRWAPNRDPAKWRWITWGAVAAASIWILASVGLNFYVANFGRYNETYGTLGGVIVLLLWMFVSALAVLLGAELDSELEQAAA